jgi:hypothetical protein
VDEPDGFSLTPIMHACAGGDVDIVRYFLRHDLAQRCLNTQTRCTKMTALHFAYESGNKTVMELLLRGGAAVRTRQAARRVCVRVCVLSACMSVCCVHLSVRVCVICAWACASFALPLDHSLRV